jgi:hypothetical protein
MTDRLFSAEDISRREMLRRSAIVGGASAMVWAAPSISSFGARAFGSQGTPRSDFSNFLALIQCTYSDGTSTTYRLQYEVDEGGWVEPGETAQAGGGCIQELGLATLWTASTNVNPADPYDLSAECGSPVVLSWGTDVVICVPDESMCACTFSINGGVAALKQSTECTPGVVEDGGKCIRFKAPFE